MTRGRALVALGLVLAPFACHRGTTTAPDAGDVAAPAPASFDDPAIARAEDLRRAKDVPAEVRTSHDPAARRRSARALARIADANAAAGLVLHLSDEDPETIAWAAYGLGYACKGREDAHVRALSARAVSFGSTSPPPPLPGMRGAAELDPRTAIARAIGRCAGALSEAVLVGLLASRGAWEAPALLGLGDLATRRKQLGAEAMTALVEIAARKDGPNDLAFYALSRAEAGDTFGKRVADVARSALVRPGDSRLLAIKTLGRVGRAPSDASPKEAHAALGSVAAELGRIAGDAKAYTDGERAEAARALGAIGEAAQPAIGEAIVKLTPDNKDPIAIAELTGSRFHVLATLLAALGEGAPSKKLEPSLVALSALTAPSEPKPGLARRIAELRCAAGLALARGTYDAEVLRKCDAETSEVAEKAKLASLLRRTLVGERRNVFRALAKSEHLRVREAAIEAIATHPELGESAVPILAEALTSKHAGLVATAADLLHAHPERAMVLAESEKRAALDPKAPPPTANPAEEVAPAIGKALVAALNEKWPEDRFETRIALIEAAASVRIVQAKQVAKIGCGDLNPVVRERSLTALRALGETVPACEPPETAGNPAAEIAAPLAHGTKVVFATAVGDLSLALEPELSPVTAARLTALAKSGFYKGIVVHRVVPGFVVQLGDPEGDGYGGSGTSLRCETSPVPFGPLDVGMALAGRDTGSSQFFVTLSRTPHLDGEYTRVGRAEGDWASLAQGDVIGDARVFE